jgi:hypothetical protein
MSIFGIPGLSGHELWLGQHGSRTAFGRIWSDFEGYKAKKATFFSQKQLLAKVIWNGPGLVWACFGSATRCPGVPFIMPSSSIACKTMEDWDQKQAETGSKMTLFKSDLGVSGRVVGVFGDCGKHVGSRYGHTKALNTSENRDFVSKNRLMRDQICLF